VRYGCIKQRISEHGRPSRRQVLPLADALTKLLIEKGPITDEDYATHVETDFGQIEVEYPVG
jgi:hypothetical protein